MTAEELNIIIKASGANAYQNAMRSCAAGTDLFSNAVKRLSGMFSVAAILKFGKDCVRVASDLQEVQNVVDNSFGNMSRSVSEWAESQAANFGLSELSAKQYLGYIGSMATQFGFTTKQAADMAEALTALTGDVASFYNLTDEESYNKLKSIFTGETESLKSIGVVMTQNALDAYAMSNGFGKTTASMSEQEKVALRYSFVLDKLKNATGDFARTSDGFANSSRSLSLQFEDLKAEIGQELLPVSSELISIVSEGVQVVGPIIKSAAKGVHVLSDAWKSTSKSTKDFIKIVSIATVPILIISAALKGSAAAMAALAVGGLAAIGVMKGVENSMEDISTSEASASESTENLGNSMNNLGKDTKGLESFLAGFDEITKLGEGSTVGSKIISTDDIANAGDFSNIIDDINKGMSDIDFEKFGNDWTDTVQSAGNAIKSIAPDWYAFWDKIGQGLYDFKEFLRLSQDQKQPGTAAHQTEDGAIYDVVNSDVNTKLPSSYTTTKAASDKYTVNPAATSKLYSDGFSSIADAIRSYRQSSGDKIPTVQANLYLDGKQITTAVVNEINSMTTSTGLSPLYD